MMSECVGCVGCVWVIWSDSPTAVVLSIGGFIPYLSKLMMSRLRTEALEAR